MFALDMANYITCILNRLEMRRGIRIKYHWILL